MLAISCCSRTELKIKQPSRKLNKVVSGWKYSHNLWEHTRIIWATWFCVDQPRLRSTQRSNELLLLIKPTGKSCSIKNGIKIRGCFGHRNNVPRKWRWHCCLPPVGREGLYHVGICHPMADLSHISLLRTSQAGRIYCLPSCDSQKRNGIPWCAVWGDQFLITAQTLASDISLQWTYPSLF